MKNYFKKFTLFDFVILFFLFLNLAPVIAPLLLAIGLEFPAKIIYFIYSFTCHQFHWRSLHVFENQYAWCTRDTFIWLTMLITSVVIKKYKVHRLKYYQAIPLIIPIALDGGLQTIATILGFNVNIEFYISNNFLRMLTGTCFGLALGFWLLPELYKLSLEENGSIVKLAQSPKRFIPLILLFNFIAYVILIAIWNFTSSNYKPENWLDFSVKTPANQSEWFDRRRNGI